MNIPALIRILGAKGMSADQIADIIEAASPKGTGAERTRRWRENKKAEAETVTPLTVTPVTSVTPVTDVSPVPSVSPEPPSTTLIPLPSEPKGSSEKTTRARKGPPAVKSKRCPNSWMPSETDIAMAKREGFTAGEIDRELAKIRDYEFRDAHSDWGGVFRNWIRKAAEKRPQSGPRHERPDQPSAKLAAKQANMERALRGAESAASRRAV